MLTPIHQPYRKPRPERRARKPKEREDNLADGLWFALFMGLVVAGVGAVFIWGMQILIAVGALMFFAWCLRWAIRIW